MDMGGNFELAVERSTWLAYYKGPAPAPGRGNQRAGRGAARDRKQPGSDLVLRNPTPGEATGRSSKSPSPPYRLYLWKTGRSQTAEIVSAATPGMPSGWR